MWTLGRLSSTAHRCRRLQAPQLRARAADGKVSPTEGAAVRAPDMLPRARAAVRPAHAWLATRVSLAPNALAFLLALIVASGLFSAGNGSLGLLSALVGVAVGAGMVVQVRGSVDIGALTDTAKALAAGDATARYRGTITPANRDLAVAIDSVGRRMNKTIVGFRDATATLEAGWREMTEVSISMSDNAETTAARASDAAYSAEMLSAAVQMVASATQELVMSFQDVATQASWVAQVAADATAKVTSTKATATSLAEASSRAEEVVKVITAVARQTHLLALNARIEAASAGVHGASFSVIADEVKHLAGMTAEGAEDVGTTVRTIQAGSTEVTGGMAMLDETIASLSDAQAAIAAAVEEQTLTTRTIGQNVTEAADSTTSIAETISQFAKDAGLTAYAGTQTRATAGNIASASASMLAIIEGFIVGADEDEGDDEVLVDSKPNALSAGVDGTVTVITNDVRGSGLHELMYTGMWSHDEGSAVTDANSYSSVVGDSVQTTFDGRAIRVYGIKDAHHGIIGVSIDGGDEAAADTYSAEREFGALIYERDDLAGGEHTAHLRITGERNPLSRFHWGGITRIEVQ